MRRDDVMVSAPPFAAAFSPVYLTRGVSYDGGIRASIITNWAMLISPENNP